MFKRKTPEASWLTPSDVSTTNQPGKEKNKKPWASGPHWPKEDNNTTYCKGLSSTLSEMIHVDTHCPAATKYLLNVD